MDKKHVPAPDLRLTPETLALLRQSFWCDFSDMIPTLTWDDTDGNA